MILRFPYLAEFIQGATPPTLLASATVRWRPLVPVTVYGPSNTTFVSIGRALVDSGADDTILPLDIASLLGITLLPPSGHAMRWRGQSYALRYGNVKLQLTDGTANSVRWTATVAFTTANIRYPLLGMTGCLEFLDARFLGMNRLLELETNASLDAVVQS